MDKLALAVATAETGNCTTGSGLSKNNAFGIMEWPNGKRRLKSYASCQDSYKDFKEKWQKGYGGRFPTLADAIVYTDNDKPEDWLRIVNEVYSK